MTDCNIRNIDNALVQRVKMAALRDNMTMREWIIVALERELHREEQELSTPRLPALVITEHDNMVAQLSKPYSQLRAELDSARTAHAESCKCFICRPPKGDR